MKGSDAFKNTIKGYLDNRAANDELFAPVYAKENKNLDDCVNYILGTVKASGCNGFADEEIFGMAVHYYQEDDIKVGPKVSAQHVVVNHVVELSEEDKAAAKQKAMDELVAKQRDLLSKKPAQKKAESVQAPTLF